MPTTILSSYAPQSTLKIFWSESHFLSLTRANGMANRVRSLLMGRYDAFALPGKLAREYVQHFAPGKTIVDLPNLVDPEVYDGKVHRLRGEKSALRNKFRIHESQRVLLVPARLNPSKGILPFLNALASGFKHSLSSLTVLIAGDGELRPEIEQWTLQHPSATIVLLGHQTQQSMCELYAIADGLALPSYSDPNPLSVVEALWAGLPLLLSDRVGNHYETLTPECNGWLFTTDDSFSVCKAVSSWTALSEQELLNYGEASHMIACRSFEPLGIVRTFVDELISFSE
jgi:glycosyltransferase involved in cell wall biosynthesis